MEMFGETVLLYPTNLFWTDFAAVFISEVYLMSNPASSEYDNTDFVIPSWWCMNTA